MSHTQRVPKEPYERELKRLQIELVTMQRWIVESGARVLVIFEGRDAAGKGGAIKRVAQYLNPRSTRVVALPQPTERGRRSVVLSAIRSTLADARRDRAHGSQLVQPRRR